MTSTTKRKIVGGSLRVSSAAVAAGVPLVMLNELAPAWFKEQEAGVAITGAGIIGIVILSAILLSKFRALASPVLNLFKKVKGPYLLLLIICGILFGVCYGVEYLYPLLPDIKTMLFGTAGSCAAGWGMDAIANAVSQTAKKEDKSDG
jgi:hypothetical protein